MPSAAGQQPLIFALLATASALQHPPFLARAHQQMPLLSRRSPPKVSFAATPRVAVAPCCTAANQTGAARPSLRTPNFSLLKRLRVPLLLSILLCAFFTQFTRGLLSCYHAYEAAAIARPLVTKAATSGVAYFLGDAIAQRFSPARVDRGRLARATIAGTVSHGPQLHFWTLALEYILPGAGWRPLLGKIALDQLIFSLYINAAFCLLTEALQRKPLGKSIAKAKAAAWPCLVAGWRFWPLAHAITYSIIPLHLRVLWVDALEVAWVAILSTCVARSGTGPADVSTAAAVGGESSPPVGANDDDDLVGEVVPTSPARQPSAA